MKHTLQEEQERDFGEVCVQNSSEDIVTDGSVYQEFRKRENDLEMLMSRVKGALKRTEDTITNLEFENSEIMDKETIKDNQQDIEDEDLEILEFKLKLAKIKITDEVNVIALKEEHVKTCNLMKDKIKTLQLENTEREKEKNAADLELKESLQTLEHYQREKEETLLRGKIIRQQALGCKARLSVIQRKLSGGEGVKEGLEEVKEMKEEKRARRRTRMKRS